MEHIWEIIGYFAAAIAGSFGGWLFGRRKYNEEVNASKVQNFDAALDAYKKMYEDIIADLKSQNAELKEEVEGLKIELAENRKQIVTLTNFFLKSAIMNGSEEADVTTLQKIIK